MSTESVQVLFVCVGFQDAVDVAEHHPGRDLGLDSHFGTNRLVDTEILDSWQRYLNIITLMRHLQRSDGTLEMADTNADYNDLKIKYRTVIGRDGDRTI